MLFEITKQKIKDLSHDNWQYIELYESKIGDIPKPYFILSESYFEKAKRYLHKNEYEIAGNFLRKASEKFCKDFLPKWMHFNDDAIYLDLNGLINKCIEYTNDLGIDNSIFTELSRHRKFVLNPTSHDTYDVPKINSEVEKCLMTVEQLQNIKCEIIAPKNSKLKFELSDSDDTYVFNLQVHDELRLLKIGDQPSTLSKCRFSYEMLKNGNTHKKDSRNIIQNLYSNIYSTSDKTKSSDFWEEIIISDSNNKIKSLRKY